MPNTHNASFSIVIPCFNSGDTLEFAIQSVLNQDYLGTFELIIVDGNSVDNTPAVLSKYQEFISCCIVESDQGLYDAWNKGIKASTGDWIIFIGADDALLSHALSAYSNYLNDVSRPLDYISANVLLRDSFGRDRVIGCPWAWHEFKHFMKIAHVGSAHSKSLFMKYGLFSLQYSICADYDFFLRIGPSLRAAHFDNLVAVMSSGGVSQSSLEPLFQTRQIKRKYKHLPAWQVEVDFILSVVIWTFGSFKCKLMRLLN